MTQRAVPNVSEHKKTASSLSVRRCPGCGRLKGRPPWSGSKSVARLLSAAVGYSLASSRQVDEALRAPDHDGGCDDASPVLVAIARVGAAVFDDLPLLAVPAASQPEDVAETEADLEPAFGQAGLDADFVGGRASTDRLASLGAEFLKERGSPSLTTSAQDQVGGTDAWSKSRLAHLAAQVPKDARGAGSARLGRSAGYPLESTLSQLQPLRTFWYRSGKLLRPVSEARGTPYAASVRIHSSLGQPPAPGREPICAPLQLHRGRS